MRKAASTLDYRALAKARLPHFLFEYIDGGSYGEITLKRNVRDLAAIRAAKEAEKKADEGYTALISPAGFVTTVHDDIKDVLIDSGYTE